MALNIFNFGKSKDKEPQDPKAQVPGPKSSPPLPPKATATGGAKPPQPANLSPISARSSIGAATTQPMILPKGGGLKPTKPSLIMGGKSTQRIVLPEKSLPGTAPRPAAAPAPVSGSVQLPLGLIVRVLPAEVMTMSASEFESSPMAGQECPIPLSLLLPQLPSGKIELTVNDLVPHLPRNLIRPVEEISSYMSTVVLLPLGDVVMRIPPDMMRIRDDQKDIDAAVKNMADPFTEEILREQAEARRREAEKAAQAAAPSAPSAQPKIIEEDQVKQGEEFVPTNHQAKQEKESPSGPTRPLPRMPGPNLSSAPAARQLTPAQVPRSTGIPTIPIGGAATMPMPRPGAGAVKPGVTSTPLGGAKPPVPLPPVRGNSAAFPPPVSKPQLPTKPALPPGPPARGATGVLPKPPVPPTDLRASQALPKVEKLSSEAPAPSAPPPIPGSPGIGAPSRPVPPILGGARPGLSVQPPSLQTLSKAGAKPLPGGMSSVRPAPPLLSKGPGGMPALFKAPIKPKSSVVAPADATTPAPAIAPDVMNLLKKAQDEDQTLSGPSEDDISAAEAQKAADSAKLAELAKQADAEEEARVAAEAAAKAEEERQAAEAAEAQAKADRERMVELARQAEEEEEARIAAEAANKAEEERVAAEAAEAEAKAQQERMAELARQAEEEEEARIAAEVAAREEEERAAEAEAKAQQERMAELARQADEEEEARIAAEAAAREEEERAAAEAAEADAKAQQERMAELARLAEEEESKAGEQPSGEEAKASEPETIADDTEFEPVPNPDLNLNAADPAEIRVAAGCTLALAKAIVELRTSRGGFERMEDLLAVPGMTPKAYFALTGLEMPVLAEVPRVPYKSPEESILELLNLPPDRDLSLKDITDRLLGWPDVIGCALGQASGLPLVGHVPKPLELKAIVAFAPKMFSAVNSSFKNFAGDESAEIIIPTKGTSYHMFKNRELYLVILCRRRQLPRRQMKMIRSVLKLLDTANNNEES
ncbi:MAG: helix-hairpin-helix domain-containing protein [Candidatus Methylacidiphilales bacterium]|nr:helix-hairpin-helix domain-containing protein [Candidatus Methylacidiphilales bacterium]